MGVLETAAGKVDLAAGAFHFWTTPHDDLVEVLFLERLGPREGLERVGIHALGSLLVLAGILLLVALPRANALVRDLLDRRAGARTALIAYAGSAHLVLPLTDDRAILASYLEAIGHDKSAEYAALDQIRREVADARLLFERIGAPVIDVSSGR